MNKYPIQVCDPVYPPKLDEPDSCLVSKSARAYDNFHSKLQLYFGCNGDTVLLLNKMEQANEPNVDNAVRQALHC